MTQKWYLIEDVNPEPWTSPEVSFKFVGGRPRPVVYKRQQLSTYQEALREEMQRLYPDTEQMAGDLDVIFFFWRQVAEKQTTDRKTHANYADVTNLQKATEDALQDILYANDRAVRHIRSEIVDQGPNVNSRILILVSPYVPYPGTALATHLKAAKDGWPELTPRRTRVVDDGEDLF